MKSAGERPTTCSRLQPNSSVQVSLTSISSACPSTECSAIGVRLIEHAKARLAFAQRGGPLPHPLLQRFVGLSDVVDVHDGADEAGRLAAQDDGFVVQPMPAIDAVVAADPGLDHPFADAFADPEPSLL